jgi:hypothetical protein
VPVAVRLAEPLEITVRVTGPPGSRALDVWVLEPAYFGRVESRPDGVFVVKRVPPGEYELQAVVVKEGLSLYQRFRASAGESVEVEVWE